MLGGVELICCHDSNASNKAASEHSVASVNINFRRSGGQETSYKGRRSWNGRDEEAGT
jgi:hypothetical protein